MRATIVSVGSEILRGTLLDTNAQYFATELHQIGFQVVRVSQVADDLESIQKTLNASQALADVVIVTGGLGPTDDDLTREAAAALTGETPTIDSTSLEKIRTRFRLRGETMPSRNAKQAWTIPSANIIPNDHGTAPGWHVHYINANIYLLPGPPRENRPMWRQFVRSRLMSDFDLPPNRLATVKTIGIGESAVADRLSNVISQGNPEVATYAKQDGVHVTVTYPGNRSNAGATAEHMTVKQIVSLLDPHVWGFDNDRLATALGERLLQFGQEFNIVEIGTAGMFSSLLLSDGIAQTIVKEARLYGQGITKDIDSDSKFMDFVQDTFKRLPSQPLLIIAATASDTPQDVAQNATHRIAIEGIDCPLVRSQAVRGTRTEICRRAALFAAETIWTKLKVAKEVHRGGDIATRSSRI